jgi:hypothetical protein
MPETKLAGIALAASCASRQPCPKSPPKNKQTVSKQTVSNLTESRASDLHRTATKQFKFFIAR